MKTLLATAFLFCLSSASLRCADPAQIDTRNWFESDDKVKTLAAICDNTLKTIEKYNEPLGNSQEKFPIMSDVRGFIGEAWVKNRHLAAVLAILSNELHFLQKLTGQQRMEFSRCVLSASFNLDTIRLDAEQDVNSLIRFGQIPSESTDLLALRDALKEAHRLGRRLKNLPPDEN